MMVSWGAGSFGVVEPKTPIELGTKTAQPFSRATSNTLKVPFMFTFQARTGLLSATADSSRKRRVPLGGVIRELQERWRLVRPEVPLHVNLDPLVLSREVLADQSLQHALLSFLHNAADAGPDDLRLAVTEEGGDALIVIEDRAI